jgi:hypothetical protein
MRDVELVLEQRGVSWALGTADASGKAERYAVRWRALIPVNAERGPATLRARTGGLAIVVTG